MATENDQSDPTGAVELWPTVADKEPAARSLDSILSTSGQHPSLEIAHVLFMDIVGYSRLPMEQQTFLLRQLQEIVRSTAEFRHAEANDALLRLPTGDGMALVFFERSPEAPVRCALEIARALQNHPQIKLRMGIHTGPVYRVEDINANKNVSGGGINIAQRVMDCGDAGHILLSKSVAEVLSQLSAWASYLHDLGECKVKHGVRVHLFNLYTDELGNPKLPKKLRWWPTALKSAAILLLVGLLALAAFEVIQLPPTPERALSYSLTVQRVRDGRDYEQPFASTGREIFEGGWKFRLNLVSPQAGYLYVLNEGPATETETTGLVTLFPSPSANRGSGQLAADQPMQIPERSWFILDKERGTEKLWLVWSEHTVGELEAVKEFVNEKDQGAITDPEKARAIQEFFAKHASVEPQREEDRLRKRVTVKAKGDVLVTHLELEHQ